jgi:hypothetical protein
MKAENVYVQGLAVGGQSDNDTKYWIFCQYRSLCKSVGGFQQVQQSVHIWTHNFTQTPRPR